MPRACPDGSLLDSFLTDVGVRGGPLLQKQRRTACRVDPQRRGRVMGGIVAPIGGDVPGEDYRFVPPTLGGERSQRPGVQARVAASGGDRETSRHADVGVSGHYGWERRSSGLVRSFASPLVSRRNIPISRRLISRVSPGNGQRGRAPRLRRVLPSRKSRSRSAGEKNE